MAETPVDEAPVYDAPAEEAPPEEAPPPPPDPTAGGAFPKFKLKFKPAAAAGSPPPEAPPPEEIPAEIPPGDEANPELGSTAEGEPGAAPEEGAPPKPRVIQLRLSEDQLPPLDPGEVKVPKAPVPKKAIIMGSVAVVVVVAIIFGGKMYLNSRVPEPAPPPPKPVVVVVPKPVEPLPDENEAPKPAPAPTVKKAAPPPKVAIAPAAATTNLGGGMSATTTDDVVATDASPAFRSWVASAKIGGVFQGSSPRVLINGRTVRVGTVVDDGLGIIFDSVDAENKMIMFKDGTGAIVSRHY